MDKITQLTKVDIKDILMNGFLLNRPVQKFDYNEHPYVDEEEYYAKTSYSGRLSEIDFLSRIYDLDNLPSFDRRHKSARGDIIQHTVMNDDWDKGWFFTDERFSIMNGDDEDFLKFICEVLHPVVRVKNEPWKEFLKLVNEMLGFDGYELYEKDHISGRPVFYWRLIESSSIEVKSPVSSPRYELFMIGEGSYANVYKYKDGFYNRNFILKRAKKDLNTKELQRFKNEFDQMYELSSPYIVEVYSFSENEYLMEYMDYTLKTFIEKNNGILTFYERVGIVNQIIRAFQYINKKGLLHRDISPTNVLIKEYEDINVVKISDFGLVKIPESTLTSTNTDFKGAFNDPQLRLDGFSTYSVVHETYALTRLIFYVLTGKTNTVKISSDSLRTFVYQGMNSEYSSRFQTVDELAKAFLKVKDDIA